MPSGYSEKLVLNRFLAFAPVVSQTGAWAGLPSAGSLSSSVALIASSTWAQSAFVMPDFFFLASLVQVARRPSARSP